MKQIVANTMRVLACQMIEKAGSGHPGLPLGFADVVTALMYEISYDYSDPQWVNRDRIIFSAGHGCALWYSVLYGMGLRTRQDLDNFRQLNSNTPGHLEYSKGIELTTGPLGMGFAWAIGIALGERLMNARNKAIDHHTFIICSDGDLMEGVSYEAAAIAGQYQLNKIIALWDDNSITIDGPTNISRNEDMKNRFTSQNWNYVEVDGHDINAVQATIAKAKNSQKPTLIACKTIIGKHSKLANTSKAHGSPLGSENFKALNEVISCQEDIFLKEFVNIRENARKKAIEWKKHYKNEDFAKTIKLERNENIEKQLSESLATREHSQNILEQLIKDNDNIIIASADLSTSCGTKPKSGKIITAQDFSGNLLPCGIRENAMVSIVGGISMHSQMQAFASTFLVFSDYARPAIRLAALMNIPMILIATHDSIAIGEDGPTHQPIEHLDSLRCMPNLVVARPADGFETFYCYECILKAATSNSHKQFDINATWHTNAETKPAVLVLTRQNLPNLHNTFITESDLIWHPDEINIEKDTYTRNQNNNTFINENDLISHPDEINTERDSHTHNQNNNKHICAKCIITNQTNSSELGSLDLEMNIDQKETSLQFNRQEQANQKNNATNTNHMYEDDSQKQNDMKLYERLKKAHNNPNGYIIACGSETSLALQIGKKFEKTVISMPFFEKKEIHGSIHIIEASSGMCWNYLFNKAKIFNIRSFGASAKLSHLLSHFKFTIEDISNWIKHNPD